MTETIPANPRVMKEALDLSETILDNIESGESSLSGVALKAKRLAYILNDTNYQKILDYEINGYPTTPDGISNEVWECAVIANRTYQEKDTKTGEVKTFAYRESIETLEGDLQIKCSKLEKMPVPDYTSPIGLSVCETSHVVVQESFLQNRIDELHQRLSARKQFIHSYVSQKYVELKFSSLAGDAFSRIQESVNSSIGSLISTGNQKFSSIHKNLESDNPEDWSNAVHSCRRILQELADAVFPPQNEPRCKIINGKEKRIKLGPDEYKNRLICFVEYNSKSERFKELVGSHLNFLIDRLESVIEAANKGSHTTIIKREEADRYVVYTYMIVGDIISLWKENQ